MRHLACVYIWILLGLPGLGYAQTGTTQLVLRGDLTLSRNNEIRLPIPAGVLDLPVIPGSKISLIPPDMAKLAPEGILSVVTDTILQNSGPSRCVSHVLIDTLYLGDGLFLTQVEITVPFFIDGTYTGESSFGKDALSPLGVLTGPMELNGLNGYGYRIEQINPANQTILGRRLSLESMEPQAGFPIQPGELDRIHLVKCNNRTETQIRLNVLEEVLIQNDLFSQDVTADLNTPPQKALARLKKPITIRYFEAVHASRAEALANILTYLYAIPPSDVMVEDMQSNYGGNPPLRNYVEVWIR